MSTFDDFTKLFDISSAVVDEFLQNSLITTEMTSAITNLEMYPNEKFLVFGTNTSQLSESQIHKQIGDERLQKSNKSITLRLHELLTRTGLFKKP